ncbi:MAG: HAD-IA family hydrolase [Candidatus Heimdallarchaeota archaeon]|nr:HAD-IA family hydrolase [Candidatus Heimdallarchaeota archaeon]
MFLLVLKDYEILSFDLFFTLVYLDETKYHPEKTRYTIWQLLENYSIKLPLEIFEKSFLAKRSKRYLPPYQDKTYYQIILEIFLEQGIKGNSELLHQVAQEMSSQYYDSVLTTCYLHPTAKQLLAKLHEKNFTLVLTSDMANVSFGQMILKKFQIDNYFDRITFSGEVGFRKPSHKIFEKTIEGIRLSHRKKMVHIGDTFETDIQGIINFGGEAIWVTNSTTGKNSLNPSSKKPPALKAIIPDISHLSRILY